MLLKSILYYLVHPGEFRQLVQFKIWYDPLHPRDEEQETERQRMMYQFLKKTSRSFSFLIEDLHPEIRLATCIFYLVLRGLDTIEDDMTIPLEEKCQMLVNFHSTIFDPTWKFDNSKLQPEYVELMKNFNLVIEEFLELKQGYRKAISEITEEMGAGMAKYCKYAEVASFSIDTFEEFDEYCYFVAGCVGKGLVDLFIASELESKDFANELHEDAYHLGLFLQKVNIIRDFAEDLRDGRVFWPKSVWGREFSSPSELLLPHNESKAIDCISELVLNALTHAEAAIRFLIRIKDQSIFNFVSVPQVMAIATLRECYQNKKILQENVKIKKSETVQIIWKSKNILAVCLLFLQNMRAIKKKCNPSDRFYVEMSSRIAKFEQFIYNTFPAEVFETYEVLTMSKKSVKQVLAEREQRKQLLQAQASGQSEPKCMKNQETSIYSTMILYSVGFCFAITLVCAAIGQYFGARYDRVYQEIWHHIKHQFSN